MVERFDRMDRGAGSDADHPLQLIGCCDSACDMSTVTVVVMRQQAAVEQINAPRQRSAKIRLVEVNAGIHDADFNFVSRRRTPRQRRFHLGYAPRDAFVRRKRPLCRGMNSDTLIVFYPDAAIESAVRLVVGNRTGYRLYNSHLPDRLQRRDRCLHF
ncbi:hypothetical protein D3C84_889070 [compost metagenome]